MLQFSQQEQKEKHLSLSVGKKTLQSIFFVVDLSIYFRHLIGILIGTVLKQLSDENHLDFIFIIYLFPFLKEPRL